MTTACAVAGLAVVFGFLSWQTVGQVATAVSALAGVAAVGVAIWAAQARGRGRSVATSTGRATAQTGGYATSGIDAPARDGGDLEARDTGDADAAGGGQAVSGIRRRD